MCLCGVVCTFGRRGLCKGGGRSVLGLNSSSIGGIGCVCSGGSGCVFLCTFWSDSGGGLIAGGLNREEWRNAVLVREV